MNASQARAMNDVDLSKELEGARRELFNLRFRLATKQLANHRELPKAKKKIALLETIRRERELGPGAPVESR
ncbi:MAG: 50S ribosomal protein L29 [Chloroflexi bacterium]|nr:50S ribosomal protein L29 [Chloroflexota bacterium]